MWCVRLLRAVAFLALCPLCPVVLYPVAAGAQNDPTYGAYGTPGLIEMPVARPAPDGELGVSLSYGGNTLRNTLSFQITPRLSGAFRYTKIENWDRSDTARFGGDNFDRSFDLQYQFLRQGRYLPHMAVGLRDFVGTGLYGAEYVVAGTSWGPVDATLGLGWGRLGSYQGFDNPVGAISTSFDTRPSNAVGRGGRIDAGQWFRGPAAAFGGLSWAVNDRVTLKAEYSSDGQTMETDPQRYMFARTSPLNFGVDYRLGRRGQISLYSLHGSEIGAMASLVISPKHPPNGIGLETAPTPVMRRAPGAVQDLGWTAARDQYRDAIVAALAPELAKIGLVIEGLVLDDQTATIRLRNKMYGAQAQAVGRMARVLSNAMPASVEYFRIVPMVRGVPGSAVVIRRSDLEDLENTPNATQDIWERASVQDAFGIDRAAGMAPNVYPKYNWSLGPYARGALFDPDVPIRLEGGVELSATANPRPGLHFSGALRAPLLSNMDQSTRASNSVLPHVRSDGNLYDREGNAVVLSHLTGTYLFRPGPDVYGRITAGYLERMYGGLSAEVLWKPVNSRLALGAEANYVAQRSYDGGLGFGTRLINDDVFELQALDTYPETTYRVATGHLSAYYAFDTGFHGQLDVGQYLAGDRGATLSLTREFGNGFKVGAYATFTDVSFNDFGEGSFDKGIRIAIPLGWQLGKPSRKVRHMAIQPITRDGGARLRVRDRLYGIIRDTHAPALENRWARFWR